MSFITMRQIDSTAQSIDALIQTGALEAARDLLRAELGPLSTYVGTLRVEAWCGALGLTQLLELPRAIAAAHVVREMRGTAAIAAFMAIAQTARAQGDEVAEFRALAGIYATGVLVWSGFAEMLRAFPRINALHTALHDRLSKDEATECLAGVMIARMLFGGETSEAATIGETLVTLALDATISKTARLRAATLLAPWFEHARDGARLHRMAEVLLPLVIDAELPVITRLIFRTSIALADTYLGNRLAATAADAFAADQLMAAVDTYRPDGSPVQWVRFFVYRGAFEAATRSGDQGRSGKILDQLQALVDPAEASQVLALHYRRSTRALRSREYSVSLAHSQRCVELAHALEMPQPIALLYENGVAAALLGLNRLAEARAIYLAMIARSMPGHRLGYERMCALIEATAALDQRDSGGPDGPVASEFLHQPLADYLRICGGRLTANHVQIFPKNTQAVVAAIFAVGLGTDVFADDVRSQGLAPPDAHPASWPWLLRVRLFDGFSIEGIAAGAQDAGKKGESKSMQIVQYLAAHAPATVAAQRLADALWPEADGDKAMRSLDVALTRLRQALPDAALLVRHEGKIGFDLNRVWCDTHAVLMLVDELRNYVGAGWAAKPTADVLIADARYAQTALALLDLYRGPMLPDSREAFARDRSAFFRSQVAGAVQIGLRAAIRLPDQAMSEEIVRKSVAHGLPADVVRSVITDLQARGEDTSRRAAQLSQVFELARA